MSGGFAVICCILGLVYLWPTVDPFGLHPHSYMYGAYPVGYRWHLRSPHSRGLDRPCTA
jgi:hypothetical protein